ncbi:formylmethanofuran dehydrogenase [Xanthobacter tagetidis]|uniref:Formylmethanofuran dehydrogenase n=1 Tax=Xanthobacter tagetidis TaxID=60216 RepID=A0A3L7A3C7_9HYPH|nr:formylmethanofuran dehydrogenase [Xanthobacter tagetidis]MBB6308782.1 formylmethanofuran dehydrogenase subunit B [Xanthobacter tagetidis]RLP74836.1 formylmethanofuran dehydrogenase [Xanthobacter tagetidis]
MSAEAVHRDVLCPFCGLGCDDLEVAVSGRAVRAVRACGDAARLLERSGEPPPPCRVDGRPAPFEAAVAAAAGLLASRRAIAIAGLGADMEGLGRLYDLAMTAGASLDHAASGGLFANLDRLARKGWVAATLAEVRNRCDLLVVLGPDPSAAFARFFERALPAPALAAGDAAAPMFVDRTVRRRVCVLGGPLSAGGRRALAPHDVAEVPLDAAALPAVAAALATALKGGDLAGAGLPPEIAATVSELAGVLAKSRYAVFAWDAARLPAADAARVAEAAAEAVAALSRTTRAAVFPLGGRDNVVGAHQLALWRFGWPLRTAVGPGGARHAPDLYETRAALADADLLLFASALRPDAPPAFARGPVIALGHAQTVFPREPDVFIPVGTPGVDHAGHVFRMDQVVCLPLAALRPAALPSLAEAAGAILAALEARP